MGVVTSAAVIVAALAVIVVAVSSVIRSRPRDIRDAREVARSNLTTATELGEIQTDLATRDAERVVQAAKDEADEAVKKATRGGLAALLRRLNRRG